ncbi:hypothetical protein [Chitinophaga arvensicola]|uniref:Uncharacterized protein n=1 Tax=Chitinophaga arvensicola TaxID=29529 RepID=A0A1I0S7S5_9BACT|nr:hypothetical protein [Chitinophaga arvensicola]SEW51870.1 hypothetical protein SAMN04488122_4552 [Chitinophaga arvensicola]
MYITLLDVKNEKEYPIEGITYQYLYSVFFLLEYEFDLYLEIDKPVSFSGRMLDLLYDRIKEQMCVLINTLYKEPSNKLMSKHPGWFIKFQFDDKKFIVDYTTYAPGKLMYILSSRLDFINSIRMSGEELVIIAKK